ncbi:TetR/AcrR family transcriptional regulator [Streptomyces sp. NPDC058686]|uniref:TetR/AcrR family transcriptional regulator n=1 Tax=Streptomyces sp. NPDC058686 TaxID=3346599 RepID=UPI00364B8101
MALRAETAAATRQALLDAAAALLDGGGIDTVTLREVGSGAGVSRSAAYRHFDNKEDLLMALAAGAWSALVDRLRLIAADPDLDAEQALRAALGALAQVARSRPHLYRLMFAPPTGDAAAAIEAATLAREVFLRVVGRVVGERDAPAAAGLLMSTTHGVADLELSGHLTADKWGIDGDGIIDLLVHTIRPAGEPAPTGPESAHPPHAR